MPTDNVWQVRKRKSWKQSEQDASHACFIQPKGEEKEQGIAMYLLLR